MFLKHTFCAQPFSFPLQFPFAKALGMYQRHGSDIMLGHETRRMKDTSINGEGKKRCSNALCRTSLERQATTSHQIKSFAYGKFYSSSYQMDGGGGTSFLVFTGKEWFPNYDFWELRRRNDLFAVNGKHMVFSERFCLPCSYFSYVEEIHY